MPLPHFILVAVPLLTALPLTEDARPPAEQAPRFHELRFDWKRDGALMGSAAVLMIGSETLFKEDLAPVTCRWCDRAPDGRETLNRLDRWGRNITGSTEVQRERSGTWSNIVGFGVLPLGTLGAQYALSRSVGAPPAIFFQDVGILFETVLLSSMINQTTKFIAGRERPFVHVLPEAQKPLTDHPSDNNLSFYSGHTSMAFSLVVSAGTVAHLRGYPHQPWIWAVGLPVAASVGLLRMGAGKHYLTDVALGAALGTASGVAVPLLLHGRTRPDAEALSLQVTGGPGGAALSGRF
ncbi:phosphatase PAP2 family protein [Stigmatella sp. ncwal1]|uniref:Phosphatase PAP2 family protein n=1 Tax=Stigmatella ashevillensis TaxID=2995309 RepID=A0ABT5DPL4_9BACT|nr:phosphatase PAP2 family protein [Stigmatella ashevillena]MDC0714999.1 phosphatase PAP2 family protein [Stigmatella ashevillena]